MPGRAQMPENGGSRKICEKELTNLGPGYIVEKTGELVRQAERKFSNFDP